MNKIDISFVMPVYNTNLLRFINCFNSIIKMKNINYELLVIDDGSDFENSLNYKKIVNKYEHCHYFFKRNGGVSSARNCGIRQAKGKYISFVDADDKSKFSDISFGGLLKKNFDLIILDVQKKNLENKTLKKFSLPFKLGKVNNNCLKKEILKDGLLNWSISKLFSRNFLLKNNIEFNEKKIVGEDIFFVNKVINSTNNILYLPVVGYIYLYSKNTGTFRNKTSPRKVLVDSFDVYKLRLIIAKKLNLKDTKLIEIFSNQAVNNIYSIYRDLIIYDKKDFCKLIVEMTYMIKYIKEKGKISFKQNVKYIIIKNNLKIIVLMLNSIKKEIE